MFEKFVDCEKLAVVMSDGGSTYLNLGEDFEVNHEMVLHNQMFVKPDRVETWFEKHQMAIPVKVHTNTIEGH